MNYDFFDLLGRIWLLMGKSETMIVLAVLTYFTRYRTPFYRALLLLLASQFINGNLKLLFQVPLFPHLGEGFALPSGHMQAAIFFWGWLMYEYRRPWLTMLGMVALLGHGYWLVHFNYHTPLDVAAAWPVAALTLASFALLIKKYPILSLATLSHGLLIASIPLSIKIAPTLYYQNATLAQGLLMGFLAGSYCNKNSREVYEGKEFLFALTGAFIGIAGLCAGASWLHATLSLSKSSYHFITTFPSMAWLCCGPDYIVRHLRPILNSTPPRPTYKQ